MTLLFLLAFAAHATEPMTQKTPFELELQKYADLQTHERWVKIEGTQYREVEYKNQKFYIKFTGKAGDFGELDCGKSSLATPRVAEGAVEVFRRTKLFVSFLEESCVIQPNGQRRTVYKLDPRLGFTLPDGPNPTITNKKIFVSPTGLGFSGDF